MSGGSWDYFYGNLEDVAIRLKGKDQSVLRKAFGNHLLQCSKAMHDIEWNDSGDGADTERENIKKCLTDPVKAEITEVMKDAREVMAELKQLLGE